MVETPSQGPAQADDDVEVEWQFDALDLRPVERWLAALPGRRVASGGEIGALTAVAKPAVRQVDRYLDTQDWRIGRAGFVLRTRRKGRRDEATLKDTAPAGAGGLRQRLEVTEPIRPDGIGDLGHDGPVGRRLHALVGTRPLHQVLEVRTRRRAFSLRVGSEDVAELALDETTIVGDTGARPVHLKRVEVEVVHRWTDPLGPVVADLREACGLAPAALSKYEAGLLALGITVPGAPDLGSTEVTADSTLGELAFAVLRRHLGALLAREPGTRLGENIEELHDMRVATRRLRAAIDLFVGVLPVRVSTVRTELGWLAAVLGEVRDFDVQLEHMDDMGEWRIAWAAGEAGVDPLVHLRDLLVARREQAREHLLAALESSRYEKLTSTLTQMAVVGPSRRNAAARIPAVVSVPDLVAPRHRSVVKGARRAKRSGVEEDFHRLRIRCKRLRYSLEFTSDLYGGRAERFVKRMAKLQDALGLMQDAEVATAQLLAITAESGAELPSLTVFAMGSVAERYRVEAADLLAIMPERLRVLAGEEWESLVDLMRRRREAALASLPAPRVRPRPAATAPGAPGEGSAEPPPLVTSGESVVEGVAELENPEHLEARTSATNGAAGANNGDRAEVATDGVASVPAEVVADELASRTDIDVGADWGESAAAADTGADAPFEPAASTPGAEGTLGDSLMD